MSGPFTLKTKRARDDYPPDQCAAVRCTAETELVDASRAVWPEVVPLCSRHWELRSEWLAEKAIFGDRLVGVP